MLLRAIPRPVICFPPLKAGPLALQELMQFVNRPFFTEENVAKEKGIIEQELRMYADHPPQHRVLAALLENMYHVNPVRLDIGGTVESVWQITKEELFDCYYSFYQPANMALAVAGDVEPEAVVALVKEHYPVWEHYNGSIERIYPAEPPGGWQRIGQKSSLTFLGPTICWDSNTNPFGGGRGNAAPTVDYVPGLAFDYFSQLPFLQ